jgi:hypothetical protein
MLVIVLEDPKFKDDSIRLNRKLSKHHFSYLIHGLARLSFLILLFPLTLGLRRAAEYETLLSQPCVVVPRGWENIEDGWVDP